MESVRGYIILKIFLPLLRITSESIHSSQILRSYICAISYSSPDFAVHEVHLRCVGEFCGCVSCQLRKQLLCPHMLSSSSWSSKLEDKIHYSSLRHRVWADSGILWLLFDIKASILPFKSPLPICNVICNHRLQSTSPNLNFFSSNCQRQFDSKSS